LRKQRPVTGQRWCPEEYASILSRVFFFYTNSLMSIGSKKHLEPEDLWDLAEHHKASDLYDKYKKCMLDTADVVNHPFVRLQNCLSRPPT
jgi:hypothetical protein